MEEPTYFIIFILFLISKPRVQSFSPAQKVQFWQFRMKLLERQGPMSIRPFTRASTFTSSERSQRRQLQPLQSCDSSGAYSL